MNNSDVPIQDVEERMRELRKQGLSLREIAKQVGCSESKVGNVVKDVPMAIGVYHKELRAALVEGTIINLETTGKDSDKDEIITFGLVDTHGQARGTS
jgi:transcriptional regulator with XRE-family HTH domain